MKNHHYTVILVGVCGTGKSVVGQKVAQRLEVPFFDADKMPATKELPAGSLPQEEDLEKWMVSLEELIAAHSSQKGCVISCSVLKREHRKRLASHIDHEMDWVFMKGYFDKAVHRVEQIGEHNRPASSLKSDFESLEIPKRALTIDMNNSEQEMVDIILKYLALKYG